MNRPRLLGQFYTSNCDYILSGLCIPENETCIVEPFAGNGDLVKWCMNKYDNKQYELYDIDPKYPGTISSDTLLNPPDYSGSWILTNPPYLARNKNKSKILYDKYKENDLYKCFLRSLVLNGKCNGGILIVPLNFWCSTRLSDRNLRKDFLSVYSVSRVNVFEERVFDDTGYTVCSFVFSQRTNTDTGITFYLYPQKTELQLQIQQPLYTIGQEIYTKPSKDTYTIKRWVIGDGIDAPNTDIILYALDDGKAGGNTIRLEISKTHCRSKESGRHKTSLIIEPAISHERQVILVNDFNKYINEKRQEFHSLFLNNYRESIDYARKRISFGLCYTIIQRLLLAEN